MSDRLALARLALAYAAFAIVATSTNLGAQWLLVEAGERLLALNHKILVFPALVFGTGVGLVVKYVLDKTWIFKDRSTGAANHARKFGLYSLMGLVTTAIFWGFELAFTWASSDPRAMYVGGALGLMIGYVLKYQLDKRFVFDTAKS